VTLAVAARMPAASTERAGRRPDWVGATLCALGLAGPTFALIRQPELGWADPRVLVPLLGGLALFAAFLAYERRASDPMLPLGLFARGNFAWGNVETLAMYGGLGALFFTLVLFLQQVAGYSALLAGTATLPATVVMFLLSRRWGMMADRRGPRLFMGFGPLVAACGVLYLLVRVDEDPSFFADVLPGTVIFALGLSITVAPLTAAILADADEHNAGIASGVNNAVARVAGLLATAAVGAVAGGALDLDGFQMAMVFSASLLTAAGAIGLACIRNPVRPVHCDARPPLPASAPSPAAAAPPLRTAEARSPGSG
jgi:predicted MFS family arabinose efflux permease